MFSIGSVFYELLTSRPPFLGEDAMQLLEQLRTEDPPSPSEIDPTIPPELTVIVQRAMRKNPAERYRDLEEMRAELELVHGRLIEERQRVLARLRQQRELATELLDKARAALEDQRYALCLEILTQAAELSAAEGASEEIAALRATALGRQESVRHARADAETTHASVATARGEAQAEDAAQHAAAVWTDAEAAAAAADADLRREAYVEAKQG